MPVDTETTAADARLSILTSDVSELAKEFTTAIHASGAMYDALEMATIYFQPLGDQVEPSDVPHATAWMLDGFTRDMLSELRILARMTLELREIVTSDLDDADRELADVVRVRRS